MDRNGKKEFERSTWTRWNGDFFGAFCCNKSNAHLEEYLWNYFVEKILDIRWQEKSTRCMSCIQSIRLHKGFIYIYIYPYFIPKIHMYQVFGPQAEEDPFLFEIPGWRGIGSWSARYCRWRFEAEAASAASKGWWLLTISTYKGLFFFWEGKWPLSKGGFGNFNS